MLSAMTPEERKNSTANLQKLFRKASDMTPEQMETMNKTVENELTIAEEAFLEAMARGDVGLQGFSSPELDRENEPRAVIYPKILQDL